MNIHTPPMTFLNETVAAQWEEGLEKNKDPYGRACYRYASEWATRMEARMAAKPDEPFGDMAKETSHEADTEGITGFMYGCAVTILAGCWVHGEKLRRWHNKDTQIGTEGDRANEEGGVLNPALLNIGGQEEGQ
jgi:hypothetical protein